MQDALSIYFDGEKYAGLLLAGVAAGILVAAAVIFRGRTDLRSFAFTLAILALAEIALGLGLYLRTGPQVQRLAAQLGSDAPAFRSAEAARMARVQRTFVIVEYVEGAIIVVCAVVALTQKHRPVLTGVGLGLLIHGAVLLAFDAIAERRGAAYVAAVNTR
jgi:hypothetical protein